MTPSAPFPRLGPEFDDFLFSSIGDDRNGLQVSVVSLLGRLNLDPWQEATGFADLPAQDAVQKLAGMIGELPGRPAKEPDAVTVATRLVGLLPTRKATGPRIGATTGAASATEPPSRLKRALLFAASVGLLAAIEFTMVGGSAPTRGDITGASRAPVAMPSQTPPAAGR